LFCSILYGIPERKKRFSSSGSAIESGGVSKTRLSLETSWNPRFDVDFTHENYQKKKRAKKSPTQSFLIRQGINARRFGPLYRA
jgi:hypothetical protein